MNAIDACLNCKLPPSACDEQPPECGFIQIQRSEAIEKVREREHENRLRQANLARLDGLKKARAVLARKVRKRRQDRIYDAKRDRTEYWRQRYQLRVSGALPSTGATT